MRSSSHLWSNLSLTHTYTLDIHFFTNCLCIVDKIPLMDADEFVIVESENPMTNESNSQIPSSTVQFEDFVQEEQKIGMRAERSSIASTQNRVNSIPELVFPLEPNHRIRHIPEVGSTQIPHLCPADGRLHPRFAKYHPTESPVSEGRGQAVPMALPLRADVSDLVPSGNMTSKTSSPVSKIAFSRTFHSDLSCSHHRHQYVYLRTMQGSRERAANTIQPPPVLAGHPHGVNAQVTAPHPPPPPVSPPNLISCALSLTVSATASNCSHSPRTSGSRGNIVSSGRKHFDPCGIYTGKLRRGECPRH